MLTLVQAKLPNSSGGIEAYDQAVSEPKVFAQPHEAVDHLVPLLIEGYQLKMISAKAAVLNRLNSDGSEEEVIIDRATSPHEMIPVITLLVCFTTARYRTAGIELRRGVQGSLQQLDKIYIFAANMLPPSCQTIEEIADHAADIAYGACDQQVIANTPRNTRNPDDRNIGYASILFSMHAKHAGLPSPLSPL